MIITVRIYKIPYPTSTKILDESVQSHVLHCINLKVAKSTQASAQEKRKQKKPMDVGRLRFSTRAEIHEVETIIEDPCRGILDALEEVSSEDSYVAQMNRKNPFKHK